jgi:hypothetical protein
MIIVKYDSCFRAGLSIFSYRHYLEGRDKLHVPANISFVKAYPCDHEEAA